MAEMLGCNWVACLAAELVRSKDEYLVEYLVEWMEQLKVASTVDSWDVTMD